MYIRDHRLEEDTMFKKITRVLSIVFILLLLSSTSYAMQPKHSEVSQGGEFKGGIFYYSIAEMEVEGDIFERYLFDEYYPDLFLSYYIPHFQWFPQYLEDTLGHMIISSAPLMYDDISRVFEEYMYDIETTYYPDYVGREIDYVTGDRYDYRGPAIQLKIEPIGLDVMFTLEYRRSEMKEEHYTVVMAILDDGGY